MKMLLIKGHQKYSCAVIFKEKKLEFGKQIDEPMVVNDEMLIVHGGFELCLI